MRTFIHISLIILFVQFSASAQDTGRYNSIQLSEWAESSASLGQSISAAKLRTSENLEGTSFYNEDWLPGIVLINNKLKSNEVLLKYDPYRNLVFFKEGKKLLALDNGQVTGFILKTENGKQFFKNGFKADKDGINRYTYLRVLHDGSTKLLVHHRTYIRKSHTSPIMSGTVTNEFRHRENYYIKTSLDEKIQDIKLRKKDLFEIIDEQYHEKLEDYASQNDLDFDSEQGMANILGFYDQLKNK